MELHPSGLKAGYELIAIDGNQADWREPGFKAYIKNLKWDPPAGGTLCLTNPTCQPVELVKLRIVDCFLSSFPLLMSQLAQPWCFFSCAGGFFCMFRRTQHSALGVRPVELTPGDGCKHPPPPPPPKPPPGLPGRFPFSFQEVSQGASEGGEAEAGERCTSAKVLLFSGRSCKLQVEFVTCISDILGISVKSKGREVANLANL